jgi:hypothetical protein
MAGFSYEEELCFLRGRNRILNYYFDQCKVPNRQPIKRKINSLRLGSFKKTFFPLLDDHNGSELLK